MRAMALVSDWYRKKKSANETSNSGVPDSTSSASIDNFVIRKKSLSMANSLEALRKSQACTR